MVFQVETISPSAVGFIRPDEGANAGLIRTADRLVVIDTTSSPAEIETLLATARADIGEVRLVINTHYHSDHTCGNQLFNCPILAHKLCRTTMQSNLRGPWSRAEIEAYLTERGQSEPEWERSARQKWADLQITLPTEVFENRRVLTVGGVRLEVIHMDAHTPDSSIVWLPEEGVLFAGDLIFEGRTPYLYDADIPAWIEALKDLNEMGAASIVPGHGRLCGAAEVEVLIDYLDETWRRTADHLAQGHSEDQAAADPRYPRYAANEIGGRHEANIRIMYAQLAHKEAAGE